MKSGLFAARLGPHSCAVPRTRGPAGRPLQRPWRTWSDHVRREAARVRQQRPQPRWPRLLGFGLMVLAGLAVIGADHPLPRDAAASSAGLASSLVHLTAESPAGPGEGVPRHLVWSGNVPPPYRVVVQNGAYDELAAFDDIGESAVALPWAVQQALAAGATGHWFVEGEWLSQRIRSPLQTFEIR